MSAELVVHPNAAEAERHLRVEQSLAELEAEMDRFFAVVAEYGDAEMLRIRMLTSRDCIRRELMRRGLVPLRRDWL